MVAELDQPGDPAQAVEDEDPSGPIPPLSFEALPYGLLRLDINGRILHYAPAPEVERPRPVDDFLGRNFFEELAPCHRVRAYRESFSRGVRARDLFATFESCCECATHVEELRVVLYYSRVSDTAWALVERHRGNE